MSTQVFVPIFQKQRLAAEIPSRAEDKLQTLIEITCKNNDKTAAIRNKPSYNFVKFKYSDSDNEPLSKGIANVSTSVPNENTDFDFTDELTFLTRSLEW